jgi:hypothetical protein
MANVIEPSGLDTDRLLPQYQTALDTKAEIERALPSEQELVLDLSSAKWFAPTFLTPITVIINKLRAEGVNLRVKYPYTRGVAHYLNMIDFPNGTSNPSENLQNTLPLCTIDTASEEDAIDIVASKMRELIRKQFMQETGGVSWLQYPFSEIIDNVDTHSNCEFGALLIQNYPDKEFLDFCIADDGVSIPGSYENSDIDFSSDTKAITMALEQGISSRPDTGGLRGYGLRTTAEMICSGLDGQILLSSRTSTRFRSGESTSSNNHGTPWEGTVFAARVHPPDTSFNYLDYISPD